jgi:glycosyltransferase involved in cell wall biosynthesis
MLMRIVRSMDTEKLENKLPISVVTITRNVERTLENTLASIKKNDPTEMIVVDGNSTDRTVEIARKYTDLIYSDGGRGMGYASQLGTEKATQEFVAYIDADVTIPEGSLKTMLAEFKNSEFIAVSAQQFPPSGALTYWEWAADERGRLSKARRTEGFLGTLACIFRRETILKYKFDTSEKHLHDVDLEMRIRQDGHKFGISSVKVYHLHHFNFKGFVHYRYFEGQVAVRYIKKWGPFHIRFWPPLYNVYWFGICIIRGKFKLLPYVIVDDAVQSAGMVKGFLKLIGDSFKRR